MTKRWITEFALVCAISALASGGRAATSGRAAIAARTREPYLGAIVVDAATGTALFEDGADQAGYPASVIKLMDMLVLQERIESGALHTNDVVAVPTEAAHMGGSQVFLDVRESFPVEDLIYALMIASANDAAVALAMHAAGSTTAFVDLMNRRAAELGMTSTQFHSVHGLPPAAGGSPDVSTPRDLAKLACAIVKHADILRYTATRKRVFRVGPNPAKPTTVLETHDHLLGRVAGCDGLKTGWIEAGGYSIIATAQRGGTRVIAVVLGSPTRSGRDAKATEMLNSGFAKLAAMPAPAVTAPLAAATGPRAPAGAATPAARAPAPVSTNAPEATHATPEPAAPHASGWTHHLGRGALILVGAVVLVGIGVRIGRGRLPIR